VQFNSLARRRLDRISASHGMLIRLTQMHNTL